MDARWDMSTFLLWAVYADFADRVKSFLKRRAVSHVRGVDAAPLDAATSFALTLIYDNWVSAMVRILYEHERPELIRPCVARYTRFHLAGVEHLLSAARGDSTSAASQSA